MRGDETPTPSQGAARARFKSINSTQLVHTLRIEAQSPTSTLIHYSYASTSLSLHLCVIDVCCVSTHFCVSASRLRALLVWAHRWALSPLLPSPPPPLLADSMSGPATVLQRLRVGVPRLVREVRLHGARRLLRDALMMRAVSVGEFKGYDQNNNRYYENNLNDWSKR
jgi:hypothetical protein